MTNITRLFTREELDPYHRALAERVANTLKVQDRILATRDPRERENLLDWLQGKALTSEQREYLSQEWRTRTESLPVFGGYNRVRNFGADVENTIDNTREGLFRGVEKFWAETFGHRLSDAECEAIATRYASTRMACSLQREVRTDGSFWKGLFSKDFLKYAMAGGAWLLDNAGQFLAPVVGLVSGIPVVGPAISAMLPGLANATGATARSLQEHLDNAFKKEDDQAVRDAFARDGRVGATLGVFGGISGRRVGEMLTYGFEAIADDGTRTEVAGARDPRGSQPEDPNKDRDYGRRPVTPSSALDTGKKLLKGLWWFPPLAVPAIALNMMDRRSEREERLTREEAEIRARAERERNGTPEPQRSGSLGNPLEGLQDMINGFNIPGVHFGPNASRVSIGSVVRNEDGSLPTPDRPSMRETRPTTRAETDLRVG